MLLCSVAKLRPLGKARLGWQNLLGYYGLAQPGTFGLGVSHHCPSAALEHTKHKSREPLNLCSPQRKQE